MNRNDDNDTLRNWYFGDAEPGAYGLIYADPPWRFKTRSDKGRGRCADRHYRVMSLADIKAMPVVDLAAKNCCLIMWATFPMLPQALEVMAAWGFAYKSGGVWAKTTKKGKWAFGTGYRVRSAAEPFLIGFRGNLKNSRRHRNLIVGQRREHSRKPEESVAWVNSYLIDKDVRKIELFSRTNQEGWDVWGDEIGKFANG